MSAVRVGIVGLGLIGGSIAKRLADLGDRYAVVGFDADEETQAAAREDGLAVATSAAEVARGAELVVVATPPERTAHAVADALAASPDALVADVASVKRPVLDRVLSLAGQEAAGRFLPSHPLAGAEGSGWPAAQAELLDGSVWAVCPPSHHAPAEPLCSFGALFDELGARLLVCDAREHDLAVARTSHAPHVVAEVIAASLAAGGDGVPAELAAALSGGALRDMTRVARSDPALWAEILQLNRAEVAAVVHDWLVALEGVRAALATSDDAAIAGDWERGREMVDLLERVRWSEPDFEERAFELPAWPELLALGRRGATIVRPEIRNDRLVAQVAR